MSTTATRALRGWRMCTLDQVVEVDNRALLPEPGTRYVYVGLEHIESETGRFVGVEEVDGNNIDSQKYFFDAAHLLYGKLRPVLNKVAIPSFSGICSTDILPLRPKPGILRDYVAFSLRTPAFLNYATNNATGTKMPRLGPTQLLKATILVPPLPIQRHIVQILSRADELRAKRRKALELADAILPTSFIGMFGDPKSNPRRFPTQPLDLLADVRSGVTKGRDLDREETVEVPYLRVANVQDGYLDLDEVKTIEVLESDVEKFRLEDGDILMTEGGDPDKLGRGCIWHDEVPGCIHQNHVFRVRTQRNRLAPEYLAALLRTQYAREYFLQCAKRSSNLASINSTQVKQFLVPLPPMPLQNKFVLAVETWNQTMARLTLGAKQGSDLLHALMFRSLNGDLTEEWEAVNAERIAAEVVFEQRLPQMILLAFLAEKTKRANTAATAMRITALMKYAFLIQMEGATKQRFYQFVPYHYGPFAKELYEDLKALNSRGVVTLKVEDEDRTTISIVDMEKAAAALAELPEDVREDVVAIVENYGALDHNRLLKTVYAKYPAFAKKTRMKHLKPKAPRRGKGGARADA